MKNKFWSNSSLSTKFNIIYGVLLILILTITMGVSILGVWYYFQKGIHDAEEFMEILIKVMGIAFIFGIFLIGVFGKMVARSLLSPLDKITKAEKEISAENLDKRINYDGNNDELKVLADSFDTMMGRLEKSFNKQNEFISDVSHELKTPISVISGYAGLLDRWGKDDKEICEKSVKAIKEETNNMSNLVKKLLLLTKTDTGNFTINRIKINLKELIDDIVEETKIIEVNRNIKCSSNYDTYIFADIGNMKEVLRILIDNSIHYTKENGTIDIYTKKENNQIYINVKDNGIGIAKEEQIKVFDRFYRTDKSRNKETGGNGLGLSIAKSIIEANGGRILVESDTNKGSTFKIIFNEYILNGEENEN